MARSGRALLNVALVLSCACVSDQATPSGNSRALSSRLTSLYRPPITIGKPATSAVASSSVDSLKRPAPATSPPYPQPMPLNLLNYSLPRSIPLPVIYQENRRAPPFTSSTAARQSGGAAAGASGGTSGTTDATAPAKPFLTSDRNLTSPRDSTDVQFQESGSATAETQGPATGSTTAPASSASNASSSTLPKATQPPSKSSTSQIRPVAIGSIMITPPVVVDPGCAAGEKPDGEGKCREVWLRRRREAEERRR